MILPMFGFIFTLIIVGSLAILVAIGDPKHARLAPYIGFTFLFAGLGALLFSVGLELLAQATDSYFQIKTFDGIGFFGGYALGGFTGALLGIRKAFRRRNQTIFP